MKRESWKRLLPWPRVRTPQERNLHLRGDRVILREKRPEDVEADYSWRVDPELAALDATTPLRMSLRDYERYFRDELEYPSPWSVRLAIETRDGTHIGNVMYYDIDEQKRQTELGIMIGDRRFWDQGYGRDAIDVLVRHIFLDTPIERIYLHTLTWNERAQAAFEKSGFNPVRNVRRDGHEFVLMEIWREEWASRKTPAGPEPSSAFEASFEARSTGRATDSTS